MLPVAFALLLMAQGTVLAATLAWPVAAPFYGIAHAALTIAAMAVQRRHGGRLAKGSLAAWVGAAAGPSGMLIGLAISALRVRAVRPLPPPAWLRGGHSAEAARTVSLERLLDARVIHADRASFVSFAAVFRHGDVADRSAALATVVRSFEPRLSPVIARAMADPDGTVRALAASASAEIVARFRTTRERLRRAVQISDETTARAALVRFLAGHARYNLLLSETQRGAIAAEACAEGALLLARLTPDEPLQGEMAALLLAIGDGARAPRVVRAVPVPPRAPALRRVSA